MSMVLLLRFQVKPQSLVNSFLLPFLFFGWYFLFETCVDNKNEHGENGSNPLYDFQGLKVWKNKR